MAEQTPTVQQLCDAAQAGDLARVEEILVQNALLAPPAHHPKTASWRSSSPPARGTPR